MKHVIFRDNAALYHLRTRHRAFEHRALRPKSRFFEAFHASYGCGPGFSVLLTEDDEGHHGPLISWPSRPRLDLGKLDESFQMTDSGGVAHFPKRLGLNLANAFAGDLELFADFLQRSAVSVD